MIEAQFDMFKLSFILSFFAFPAGQPQGNNPWLPPGFSLLVKRPGLQGRPNNQCQHRNQRRLVMFLAKRNAKVIINSEKKRNNSMNQFINVQELHKLILHASKNSKYDEILATAKEQYVLGLNNEQPGEIYQTALRINEREIQKEELNPLRKSKPKLKSEFWAFGELKVFSWVSVYYCHSQGIQMGRMRARHFEDIQKIFLRRNLEFIMYEVNCIAHSKNKIKDEWLQEEQAFLCRIVESMDHKNEWRYISFQLFSQSQGQFFRTLQQCREKWINYLNPNVRKTDWTLSEDIQLFSLIETFGCKWAVISRQFKGSRTEHMVKNRYNSFLKNWRHKSCKKQAAEDLTSKILGNLRRRLQKEEQQKGSKVEEGIIKQKVAMEMRVGFGESRVEMGSQEVDISVVNAEEMKEEAGEELDEYSNLYLQQPEPQPASSCDSNYLHLMMARTAKETDKEDKRTRDEEDEEYLPQLELFLGDSLADCDQLEDNLGKREQPGQSSSYNYLLQGSNGCMGIREVNEIVKALGCCHFERLVDDKWLDELEEKGNLEWIQ